MLTDSPTEMTTAITDVILAAQSAAAIYVIRRKTVARPMWTHVWTWLFALLSIASLIGAAAHGLEMAASIESAIWSPAYLALGLAMALFVIAAITMSSGHEKSRRFLLPAILIAFVFFTITQIWSDSFLLFVIYECMAMFLSLTLYTMCFWQRNATGSGYLASGVLVGILAAVIDTQKTLHVTLIWEFNNHGVFHLVQMISLLLLTIGLYRSHREEISSEEQGGAVVQK
jgi:hypothetical protein